MSSRLSAKDLEALRSAEAAATPGPWATYRASVTTRKIVPAIQVDSAADAHLLALLRNPLPDLLDMAEALGVAEAHARRVDDEWGRAADASDTITALRSDVERLTRERDEARDSDAESLSMYRSARDRAA